MSMFFRSRPPRKLRRKSGDKARHGTLASRVDLFGPGPHAIPIPIPVSTREDTVRRRRQRAMGYIAGRPRQPRFRVT